MQAILRTLTLTLCISILVGSAQAGSPNSAAGLIPREVLFGNPDKASAQISPDGLRLAFLAPVDGVLNVWVGPVHNPAAAKPVTNDRKRGIRGYGWTYDSRYIGYTQDKDGDENWHVYVVDLKTNKSRDLTPIEGVQARIQQASPKFPNEVLIAINDRNPVYHDIYRINVDTGEKTLVIQNDGYAGFLTDDDYQVRFASQFTPDGGRELFEHTPDGQWKSFIKVTNEDALTTGPAGFDKSGRVLYMIDSRGRNTAAFTTVDIASGKQTIVAEDPRVDIADIMAHPTEKTVQAVAFMLERKQWKILDKSIEADFAYLRTVANGDFEIISRTLDDQTWVVAYLMDNGPVRYYSYDRPARKANFLFTNRTSLEGLPLAKMHPVTIKSRDGYDLVNYLTLPVESDADVDARPDQPLPMVLFVHGGPWARDSWGYDPYHQWLANRGYAVMSVNFRGSTGFGKKFLNAANGEWGGKMHDDLLDSVKWAIKERIADPDKVAIMGGSYGGYATLVGLTFTPDVFACGVDIVGVSNLVTFMQTVPPYWMPIIDMFKQRVGDHETEAGRAFLIERSPLTHVDRIQRPLLIAQGANDPRVNQAESDQIVEAMQRKNIPVTYVLFPDEGHGFARPENRLAFNAITEAFLAEHLGGRVEPIGDDFKDSSVKVPVGADDVAGVTQALRVE